MFRMTQISHEAIAHNATVLITLDQLLKERVRICGELDRINGELNDKLLQCESVRSSHMKLLTLR